MNDDRVVFGVGGIAGVSAGVRREDVVNVQCGHQQNPPPPVMMTLLLSAALQLLLSSCRPVIGSRSSS